MKLLSAFKLKTILPAKAILLACPFTSDSIANV